MEFRFSDRSRSSLVVVFLLAAAYAACAPGAESEGRAAAQTVDLAPEMAAAPVAADTVPDPAEVMRAMQRALAEAMAEPEFEEPVVLTGGSGRMTLKPGVVYDFQVTECTFFSAKELRVDGRLVSKRAHRVSVGTDEDVGYPRLWFEVVDDPEREDRQWPLIGGDQGRLGTLRVDGSRVLMAGTVPNKLGSGEPLEVRLEATCGEQ